MNFSLKKHVSPIFHSFRIMMALCVVGIFAATSAISAEKDYGKPGESIQLTIGYQPYYTESWSGLIMRDKKFYEKYLPQGSTVTFQIGLAGAVIVNGMLDGSIDVGYVGDMPGIVATSRRDTRDIRIVSVLGLGYDQCNVLLVRKDAPQFASTEDAFKWLDGKAVAAPKGSCADRFAQAMFKKKNLKPSKYASQSIEVITSGLRARTLDAAVIWEPTASRLIQEGLVRKVGSGLSIDERDGGLMVMPQALIEQRPDITKAWLEAELDAQLFFADSKNAMEITKMAAVQTIGFENKALWASAFGSSPKAEGGADTRVDLAYGFTPEAQDLIKKASTFLLNIKSIRAEMPADAVMPQFTAEILKKRGLTAPIGEVKAQLNSAFTEK